MKNLTLLLFIFHLFALLMGCSFDKEPSTLDEVLEIKIEETSKIEFQLSYVYAGLGSGYNSMQPPFSVEGRDFTYLRSVNSSFGDIPKEVNDTLCTGQLRVSSIDSIIAIVDDIHDTLIYNTDVKVLSGGIHSIQIRYQDKKLNFSLHNASDSSAQKIVDILNSNLPDGQPDLWLFNSGSDFSTEFSIDSIDLSSAWPGNFECTNVQLALRECPYTVEKAEGNILEDNPILVMSCGFTGCGDIDDLKLNAFEEKYHVSIEFLGCLRGWDIAVEDVSGFNECTFDFLESKYGSRVLFDFSQIRNKEQIN